VSAPDLTRFAVIAGQLYPAGGLANNAPLIAALLAAGIQSAPLVDEAGRWFGYEIYYHPPGRLWGPSGYLATRESRDWSVL
jgi:hypothetical protein